MDISITFWLAPLLILTVIVWSWVGFLHYYYKIIEIRQSNEKGVKGYSKEIVVGIVSGLFVLVVDRIITNFLKNLPLLKFDGLSAFFISLINAIFSILLTVFGLLFCVSFIIYKGMSNLKKEKT